MSNRLTVTTVAATPHGQLLVESIDHLVKAREGLARLLLATGQMTYGNPTDYEQMKTELGMESAEKAADLASLLTSALDKLNDPLIIQLIARCDQAG